jgi:tRNA U34 2-thiouridine synthase MnmA/TrmU
MAKVWMEEHDHHFVFTGEVVGQRPKSQMRPTLRTVERESGLSGYLLRPLSAKLLEPTAPELRGWVDRGSLYDISGRGRKRQIALAEHYGITEYAQPSGGCCFLIDKTYSRRLRDFLGNEGPQRLVPSEVLVLAVGRHLRLPSGAKLVVGRHEQENAYLAGCEVEGPRLVTVDHPGPTAVLCGAASPRDIQQAAQIVAGYSDGRREPAVRVRVSQPGPGGHDTEVLAVAPADRDRMRQLVV